MHFLAVAADESLGARQHFLRSPAGEGQQEDALGFDAALDQMRDAIDERARLSGSGAGDDEKGAVAVGCSRGLLWVQIRGEVALRRRDESLSSGVNPDGACVRHWTSNIGCGVRAGLGGVAPRQHQELMGTDRTDLTDWTDRSACINAPESVHTASFCGVYPRKTLPTGGFDCSPSRFALSVQSVQSVPIS